MTSFANSTWCSFRTIPSAAEAALVSANCRFSLATLEVNCRPRTASFALTEREHDELWRWAIVSPDGSLLVAGREATQALAKRTAENTLRFVAA